MNKITTTQWSSDDVISITEGVSSPVLQIEIPVGQSASGLITVAIEAFDGTDRQCSYQVVGYAIVNKGDVLSIGSSFGAFAAGASSGTLTVSLATFVDIGGGVAEMRYTATSSLNIISLTARVEVLKNY